jgi:hypothetical protein
MNSKLREVLGALVLPSFLIGSALAADDSPMAYFAAQDAENAKKSAPILAATTPEELIELGALPERVAGYLAEISPEEKAEFLHSFKQDFDSRQTVAEKIDGDRAVVLRESAYPTAWNIVVEMSRTDGVWTPGKQTMMLNDSGAHGSFVVKGAVTAQLTEGQVAQSDGYYAGDKEFPVSLNLSDVLLQYLDGHAVPMVTFSHTGCLTPGGHSITHPRGGYTTGGEESSDKRTFDENISGTLEVTKVEDGRFWADFEMTAVLRAGIGEKQDPTQTVSITGTIENAINLCPGGAPKSK